MDKKDNLDEELCPCGCGKKKSECDCGEGCKCNCKDENNVNETEKCYCENPCDCVENEENNEENKNYLNDLLRVQAEFDNYRKRMQTALGDARQDGFMDAIEKFLPALDSFKMATDMITDKNTLMGIQFIEKGILDTLSKMGVEAIKANGKFNPELHQAIDSENAEGFESGDIIKEAYKGFTYNGKVIRYSQVIVKK